MTKLEEQNIKDLFNGLREENRKFREDVSLLVNTISSKVEKKFEQPILEKQIVECVQNSIQESISKALTGYNSPLQKFAENVVNSYKTQIEGIFNKVVGEALSTPEFEQKVREALLHKITKTMINGVDGTIEKTITLMKQDVVFRSKLTLAVNGIVNEFLNQK